MHGSDGLRRQHSRKKRTEEKFLAGKKKRRSIENILCCAFLSFVRQNLQDKRKSGNHQCLLLQFLVALEEQVHVINGGAVQRIGNGNGFGILVVSG